jgi:hypothetical protein
MGNFFLLLTGFLKFSYSWAEEVEREERERKESFC